MNIKLKIFMLIILLVVLAVLVRKIQKKKIDLKYSLSWFGLIIVIIIFDLFPELAQWLSELIGVKVPSNFLLFSGMCLVLIVIYTQTAAISKLSDDVRSLTQKIGLLESRIRELEDKNEEI